ncbi:sugar phosphate nucleotidyltransferase [Roseococcus sp. YIM B11640]|uniref:sugar phosphate nucleotidyltransferase n=1 Tax=Roseococcus sp. YIM B11640 TaxID=3133973 RepID=UPI003C7D41A4
MWGIIPAAGIGSRIQPLAFSKELLPVGSRLENGVERPRAVSEHLIERMIEAGVDKLCFVIAPGKSDIVNYYGARIGPARITYVVQAEPAGLCDAIFSALPCIDPGEQVAIGLPDTIWFPTDGLARLPPDKLSFLLFPVDHPEFFDAVVTDGEGRVREIQVKQAGAASHWVWGAFRMPGHVLHALHALWREAGRGDEYVGTLVNAWLARGGQARGICAGETYVDVGTMHGWREAVALLGDRPAAAQVLVPFRALQQTVLTQAAAQRHDQPLASRPGAD